MQTGFSSTAQLALWGLATLLLGLLSRRSLKNPRCHGFYRFFAFSASTAVAIPVLPYWHEDLFAAHQIASWLLLFPALGLVISGMYLLQTRGGQRGELIHGENFSFENTATLIDTGVFRLVRHPMYSALILFTWGAWLKQTTWLGLCLCLAASVFLWFTATAEERENLEFFGEAYRLYTWRTKRFIPFLL